MIVEYVEDRMILAEKLDLILCIKLVEAANTKSDRDLRSTPAGVCKQFNAS